LDYDWYYSFIIFTNKIRRTLEIKMYIFEFGNWKYLAVWIENRELKNYLENLVRMCYLNGI
jgi:hypothetical protein